MANILFLAHRIPYPPNKGDKIRSWNFLSHLLAKHNVHLGFFLDDKADLEHIPFLERQTESICFQEIGVSAQKIRSVNGFLTGDPLTLAAYPYKKLRNFAHELINGGQIDLVFLFSAACGPIISEDCDLPIIADLVDVDSEKWKSYSMNAPWPLSWVYKRESKKLGDYERELSRRACETTFVSEQEAELFSSLQPSADLPPVALPNGVNLKQFDPARYKTVVNKEIVIFTGAMNYQPNIDAVEWFCRGVWPKILAENPSACFRIAGGPISPKVEQLSKIPSVEILGYVDDMAKEIASARICVAPLLTARGIQNKVLEAMAMAKPTVVSSLANEGINALDNENILVADTPIKFAGKVNGLLVNASERARVGAAAREFVEVRFTWEKAFTTLDKIVGDCL